MLTHAHTTQYTTHYVLWAGDGGMGVVVRVMGRRGGGQGRGRSKGAVLIAASAELIELRQSTS